MGISALVPTLPGIIEWRYSALAPTIPGAIEWRYSALAPTIPGAMEWRYSTLAPTIPGAIGGQIIGPTLQQTDLSTDRMVFGPIHVS